MSNRAAPHQLLPIDAYTSEAWFRRERSALFGHAWMFATMADDLKAPGDYHCVSTGGPSLILLRDDKGELRAFHNRCRHRGSRLLEEGRGTLKGEIACFYHRWTYDLSGRLTAVTLEREQLPGIDKSCYGLHPAKVAQWRNLIFVNPDPAAEDLEAWLAGVPAKQKRWMHEPGQLHGHDPEKLVEVSNVRYRVRANWKIVVENFIDGYHLPLLHRVSLADGDFMKQKWEPEGRHVTFYRPLRSGISHNDQPLPVIEGIPPSFGLAYYWMFPNVAWIETATTWSTFHVIPVSPGLSIVHSRVRGMPEALSRRAESPSRLENLPDHVISASGAYADLRLSRSKVHPLQSNNVMREDIYACEAVQESMESGLCDLGPFSRWESSLTFFQENLLAFMEA